jgi:hypothetical protein
VSKPGGSVSRAAGEFDGLPNADDGDVDQERKWDLSWSIHGWAAVSALNYLIV